MTKKEFVDFGDNLGFDFTDLTDEDFEKIELIREWYPSLDEDQPEMAIVGILAAAGMKAIEDMLPRARRNRDDRTEEKTDLRKPAECPEAY